MGLIRIAIAGIGNCASSLIQGIEYYRAIKEDDPGSSLGLMHYNLGGYLPGDIVIAAAFDIDARKVHKPLEEAMFAKPNCTKVFFPHISGLSLSQGVIVQMGEVLDGVAAHMDDYPDDRRFIVADERPCDVVRVLRESSAE